jgi:hypothetical protein
MAAPSVYPDWDTNLTNTTAIASGHTTDGYDTDEVPDSDEFNQWMAYVGLWIRYLGSFTPGTRIGYQIKTGSGTYTPTTGTRRVRLRGIGGGGSGGGASSVSSQYAAAAGGGSGVYIEKWIDPAALIVGGAYVCGAGGSDSAGGDSTISIQSTTYTAAGGALGEGDTGSASSHLSRGFVTGPSGSTGDIIQSEFGGNGLVIANEINRGGDGASGPWGTGGDGASMSFDGNPALGHGAGGGGGVSTNAAGTAVGGVGSAGMWIIEEFA